MSELLPIMNEKASTLTMSSVEIAQLCEKRHDHVMNDIRKMLDELNLHAPDFSGTYKTSQGNEYQCFFLPKREVMILVSGYRIDLRAKIVDRLDELENQQKPTALSRKDLALMVRRRKRAFAVGEQATGYVYRIDGKLFP